MTGACAVLPSVPSGSTIFSHVSLKRYDFRKKREGIEGEIIISGFSTDLSETFFILRRTERDAVTNEHKWSCEVPPNPIRF